MERFDGLRPARLKVGIISAGRVGTALGVALQRADHVVVACSAISHASRRRAQRRLPDTPVLPPLDVAASAELLLLAVTDSELAGLVSGLAATSAVRPQTIVAHTSGANGIGILAPLAQQGCIPLAIHPAMTFTGSDEDISRLPDTCFGIIAADDVGYAIGQSLVLEMGGEPFCVREDARILYHAALAHASNHIVTVLADALEALRAALSGGGTARPTNRRRPAGRDRGAHRRAAGQSGAGEHAAAGTGRAHRTGRPRRCGSGRGSSGGPRGRRRSAGPGIPDKRAADRAARTRPRGCRRGFDGMTIPAFHPGELNVYSAPGDVADVSRALRLTGRRVMLVPTMGALHEGHLALVRAAKRVPGSVVVVSIFVNPMQFGAGEDLDAYPRTPDDDLAQLRAEGVEIAFTPTTAAMYPDGLRTTVQPGPLAAELEGGPRPTHFAGVLTVVLKLLQIVRPDRVFFGEKDYQQLVLIRQLVADFNLDVAVVGVPTVREADGLAMSSRNRYLDPAQRAAAVALSAALTAAAHAATAGAQAALDAARAVLDAAPGVAVDYLELRDIGLGPMPLNGSGRLLVAARLGTTRLLDNIAIEIGTFAGTDRPDGYRAILESHWRN